MLFKACSFRLITLFNNRGSPLISRRLGFTGVTPFFLRRCRFSRCPTLPVRRTFSRAQTSHMGQSGNHEKELRGKWTVRGCFSNAPWLCASSSPHLFSHELSVLLHLLLLLNRNCLLLLFPLLLLLLLLSVISPCSPPFPRVPLSPHSGLGRFTASSMLIGFIPSEHDHWAISNYFR